MVVVKRRHWGKPFLRPNVAKLCDWGCLKKVILPNIALCEGGFQLTIHSLLIPLSDTLSMNESEALHIGIRSFCRVRGGGASASYPE